MVCFVSTLRPSESVLRRSSGSISYDLFGAGSSVEIGRMAEVLVEAFSLIK